MCQTACVSDTAQIIAAVIGTGITLLGILAGLLVSLFRILRLDTNTIRQEIAEIRQDVRALHSRIDALYQTLFSHKDPAA